MGNSSSKKSSKKTGYSPTVSQAGTAAHTVTAKADEPPPAYSTATAPGPSRVVVEDALLTIRNYNVVFVIDDSGSMSDRGPKGVPLWTEARIALGELAAQAQKYDTDGIELHFFNNVQVGTRLRNPRDVENLFNSVRPRGITPMAARLEKLLLEYLSILESDRSTKPVNYIVLTDGAPTDEPESVIVAAAQRLDKGNFPITQVGIQFVQIGDDPHATKFLTELDDDLKHTYKIRDIVDTTPYAGELTAETLTKILLGGINRRVDRKGGSSVM